MSAFRVPSRSERVEIRVSNSRFFATAGRADSSRAAQEFLRDIRGEMPDATHHVYAFRIGHGASVSEGMGDDGEPSGTAGPPTLAVVRGSGLGDIVVVTARYFGGTKLGTGGLVSAYTAAAQAVLAAVPTEEKVERRRIRCTVPYTLLDRVRLLIDAHDTLLVAEVFGAGVELDLHVPVDELGAFRRAIGNLSAGQIVPEDVPPTGSG